MNAVGKKIRKLRVSKGLSLEDLAYLSNTSHTYIWNLEKDYACRRPERIKPIAEALGVSINDLLEEVPVKDMPTRGAPWKKGQSGNPIGRPKGAKNLKKRENLLNVLMNAVEPEWEEIINKQIELALRGDFSAAKLLLTMIIPYYPKPEFTPPKP